MRFNRQIKSVVYKYERLGEWYAIGPMQRAILEDYTSEIIVKCAQIVADANMHKLPADSYAGLILEEFGITTNTMEELT